MKDRKAAHNSTYPKVAVQWLNQALCIYQSLCLVDSVVLRNPLLRQGANLYPQPYNDFANIHHKPSMIEVLRHHIIARLGNDLGNLDKVLANFKHISTKRNEHLLQQGDTCQYVYFIAKGCLQVYVYDKDFNETTRDLVIENNWCSELISFGRGIPATENIRAVEPCEIFAIDRNSFQTMMEAVPQFDKVYKQILEASYANSVYRINTFVSLSALDRIKWLMQYRPTLMKRLPGKLIASYLGINKDVFSRLKAQL